MKDVIKSWARNPFTVQDRTIDFVTENENFTGKVLNSILELTSKKKQLLLSFHRVINAKYPQLSEKTIRKLLPLPTTYLHETRFPSYTYATTIYHTRVNVEADMKLNSFYLSCLLKIFAKV